MAAQLGRLSFNLKSCQECHSELYTPSKAALLLLLALLLLYTVQRTA